MTKNEFKVKKNIKNKAEARQYAMDWQSWVSDESLSYSEMAEWQAIFAKLAERFNLQDDFSTNGII